MAPRDYMKLLLKLTAFLMFVFSTPSTKQCTPKKTERDGYVIRNVGIKLCQLKCAENSQCLSIVYDVNTLTCLLSKSESKKIKTKEGHAILARDHSHVSNGSCTFNMCSFTQRCLKTRSGKEVCVQNEKQNYLEYNPQHKVDDQETFANSALHDACRKGNLNRVRQIVSRGSVDINSRDEKQGRTPLMVAAHGGYCEIFRFLTNKGANKSHFDNDCKNALQWACKGGHAGIVECVLQQYSIVKNKPLSMEDIDVLETLVCSGSNLTQVDQAGQNILHYSSMIGSMAIMKYAVSLGSIDINTRSKDGMTPLMMAALWGKMDVFKFLVSMGGDSSHVDNYGHNILHLASSAGHVEMVKHILSQNLVDVNARDMDGETAAMTAKRKRKVKIYNLLVSRGRPVK